MASSSLGGSLENWLKSALALLYAKESLTEFVSTEITQQQREILEQIKNKFGIPSEVTCSDCTTANLLKCRTSNFCNNIGNRCNVHNPELPDKRPDQRCPKYICNNFENAIRQEHRYNNPSWKNSDAKRWCSEAIDIAKCYMPKEGYSSVTSFEDTDFNGIVSVIINNKRFQAKLKANLNKKENICEKARDVGRAIRHSPNFLLTQEKLSEFIEILTELLSDSKYLAGNTKAQEAINKMDQLPLYSLTINDTSIPNILDDQIRLESRSQHRVALQELTKKLSGQPTIADIEKIWVAKLEALVQIEEMVVKKKHEFREYAKGQLEVIYERRPSVKNVDKCKELQRYLINFYKNKQCNIPVSPLLQDNDVHLETLYVQPPLEAIEHRLGNSPGVKTPVDNYQRLFFGNDCNNEKPYKYIYVTANAGVGKTSFCKHICMTWCRAHEPETTQSKIFRQDDIQALTFYEFVFFISLRDVDESLCDLDELVKSFVRNELQRGAEYCDLVDKLLGERTCLIVLDSLDEWQHPNKCQKPPAKQCRIPHERNWEKCTIMTTTRDWKFEAIRLPSTCIDRHIKIKELDDESSQKLVSNALYLLNKDVSSKSFIDEMKLLKLGDIIHIPYINLQTVCLWNDGAKIGNSKCEIYTNVFDLTLERGIEKHGLLTLAEDQSKDLDLNHVLKGRIRAYSSLLFKLGKLAFHTLFRKEKESSLLFDESLANKYIESEQELQFCLNIGLLSRSKVYGLANRRRIHVSFQHKSIHEYLSAIYIQSDSEHESSVEKVVEFCTSLETVLAMSNVFIFLSGLNASVYTSLFVKIAKGILCLEVFHCYRANLDWSILLQEYYDSMYSFQNFQVECASESIMNGNASPSLYLEDIIIDKRSKNEDFMSVLEKVKPQNLKSFSVRECADVNEFKDITKKLSLLSIQSLEKLDLWINADVKDVEQFLSNNKNTLRSVGLRSMHYKDNQYCIETSQLSVACLKAFTDIPNLQALVLVGFAMTHHNLESMANFLTRHTTLTQIGMRHIDCLDHEVSCEGVVLDLSQHENLRFISLHLIPLSRLNVHTKCLEACDIGHMPADFAPSLLTQMQDAPKLYLFSCMDYQSKDMRLLNAVLPKLLKLKVFDISYSDLENCKFPLSSDLKQLERIKLWVVSMLSSSLRALVEAIPNLPQPVVVTLVQCTVTPETEYEKIKKDIEIKDMFHVIYDGRNASGDNEFTFQTVKTGECVI